MHYNPSPYIHAFCFCYTHKKNAFIADHLKKKGIATSSGFTPLLERFTMCVSMCGYYVQQIGHRPGTAAADRAARGQLYCTFRRV